MIAKFYGVYTIEETGKNSSGSKSDDAHTLDKTHIFITRNISQAPKEYILRTFDLKGSTVDREVIKDRLSDNLGGS